MGPFFDPDVSRQGLTLRLEKSASTGVTSTIHTDCAIDLRDKRSG